MPNNYGLFFSRKSDGLVFRLPVNPDELPVVRDTENDDENVLGLGPIMIPRIPSLKEVTISSYFPGRINPMTLTSGSFKEPYFYINFFETAMIEKQIITYTPERVYENGEPFMTQDIGFDVLVTHFEYTEKGGETGDFYYKLELTEYKDYSPIEITLTGETDAESGTLIATAQKTRSIPEGQLYVGVEAVVNGNYYYSSYGDEPHGNGNGRTCIVSRIVTDETREYPVHITTTSGGDLGWVKKDALTVVNNE
nr:MAG TPA: tail assembly protein [Caudoviricetes sp.]